MKVKLINTKGDWNEVVNRARVTVNKEKIGKEPSDTFKKKILRAEHSPIRGLIYCFEITDVKSWVVTHLVRHHVGVEKWVRTQRTDRTNVNRDMLPQGNKIEMEIEANAQALINMARKRLCTQASVDTREVMQQIKNEVKKHDPILADVMVKECVYRGYCPEMWSCGYTKTKLYEKEVEEYRKVNNDE